MTSLNRQRLKRWGGGVFTLALLALAGWLTKRQLRDMEWSDVVAQFGSYGVSTIALVLLAASISYAAVSQYDLIGRHYTGHSLSTRRVMAISFIGYTFSLNLGALIGGMGFRYRLYSNADLPASTATKVIGLSFLGNWSGYVLLASLLFLFSPPQLPPSWNVGSTLLHGLGFVLLATSCAYVWLCWRHAGRTWKRGSVTLVVPSLGIACIQFTLSVISWCANATILFILLPDEISWFMALAALLTSVTAAVLAHVPGGIGVIELVFVAMLAHIVPESNIIAALLGYRCAYYLLPFLLAIILYVSIEVLHARAASRDEEKCGETA